VARREREKLPLQEFFDLKPGDVFTVYYAKDDDPTDVRFEYETRKVLSNKGGRISDDEGDIWGQAGQERMDRNDNQFDMSRGHAHLYKA
jgi:hypothetical protein